MGRLSYFRISIIGQQVLFGSCTYGKKKRFIKFERKVFCVIFKYVRVIKNFSLQDLIDLDFDFWLGPIFLMN